MNTLSWSIAMAAWIYSVNLPAAEDPVTGEKAIVVETRADVAGPKSAPLAEGRPREAKVRKVGPEQFEIEFVGESKPEAKDKKSSSTAGEPAEEHEGFIVLSANAPQGDRFWIGLEANPLSAEQRKELKVEDGQGLLIEQIAPDGPAAKAGLKSHDVLLKASEKPLKQISDLVGAIQESKGGDLLLELQRDGNLQKITVNPAKRPGGGLEYRLVEPDSRPAQSDPKAEAALTQARASLLAALANVRELGTQGSSDAQLRELNKALLAERHALQENLHALNEQLESLANSPDSDSTSKIRGQMHEVMERIEALNRQAVALEMSRINPYQEQLSRQLKSLRQCAAELEEVGRKEDATRLNSAAHEVEERLATINQARDRSRSVDTQYIPGPGMPGAPLAGGAWQGFIIPGVNPWGTSTFQQADPEQVRESQIKAAIQLLEQAGLREDAQRLRQKLEASEREQKERRERTADHAVSVRPDLAVGELRSQVEQMHRELKELQEAVARLNQGKK
jgi:hypothetical protein